MKRHPSPRALADYLHRFADQLSRDGQRALDFAPTLAARGWPATVTRDGGRSADPTTTAERAALNPGPHDGIDERLDTQLHAAWYAVTQLEATLTEILGHASDDDPIPVGRGSCDACSRFCHGDGNTNRLRSGFCASCYQRWRRWRKHRPHASRSDFVRSVRNDNGEPT